jgi:hypothetical protein
MIDPDKSFITAEGGLEVLLRPNAVTWFDFLAFSRITNSLQGGWNSKTHWWTRGVPALSDKTSSFLNFWTKNSLQRNSLPHPRVGGFLLDRLPSESRSDLERELEQVHDPVEDASENALNYALFKGGLGRLIPLKEVNLLGYEIPLAAESNGQLKIDLFGVSSGADAIEIIELKKAGNTGDSPLLALTEALCYALQTLRCKKDLLKYKPLEGKQTLFAQINLTLLAPGRYWDYWCERDKLDRDSICETFRILLKPVNDAITKEGYCSKLTLALRELESVASRKPAP